MTESSQKKNTLRSTFRFYLIDCKTLPGNLIDIFIILLNLGVCTTFVIETYPVSDTAKTVLWNFEVIAVFVFIIEYAARLYGSDKRIKHIISIYSVIDLVAIFPTLILLLLPAYSANVSVLKLIRIFRVLRIFRFLRFTADPYFFFGNITMSVLRVIRLLMTLLLIFFVSSGLFWIVESPLNDQVQTFGDAFYFSVVALTTVGFGDIIPASEGGRWVTVLMILSGIEKADFNFLLWTLEMTRGNLSSHMDRLEQAGYIEILKSFNGKMPNTSYRLTKIGEKALSKYWQTLDEIKKLRKGKS